jgi:cysteine dioxygenase
MSAIAIQELVSKLRCCTADDFLHVDRIRELLRTSPVDPKSIEQYLIWDLQHYTRNLIDKTPLYELLAICWETGQVSSIHNHKEQNCWMAVPIGRLLVQNYSVLSQDLANGTCDLAPSNVIEMNPQSPAAVDPQQPVHKVFNPPEFGQRAVSLHVYSRPYDRCVVYSAEQHKCGEIELHYTSEFGVANSRGASQVTTR